jgi:[ribosomal protein S5]-alanine N-acetyltransferase
MRALTMPRLAGDAFRLRPLEHADMPAWYAFLRLPHVVEHTSWNLASVDDLRPSVDAYESDAPASAICFAIESVADAALVGSIGFNAVSVINRNAEIAYTLHPDWWGRGIATRCCRAVVAWGFSDQDYVRIQGTALDTNLASMRVLEKCGFEREGKLFSFRHVRGQPRDFWMYSIVAARAGGLDPDR